MGVDINEVLEIGSKGLRTESNAELHTNKTIANVIKIIGISVIVIGTLAGLIVMFTLKDPMSGYLYSKPSLHPLRWIYGMLLIFFSLISGVAFIGFSEVIHLLRKINRNLGNRWEND